MLGVDRERLGRWVHQGRVRTVRLDGDTRIPMPEIDRICAEGLPQKRATRVRHHQRKAHAALGDFTDSLTDDEVKKRLGSI